MPVTEMTIVKLLHIEDSATYALYLGNCLRDKGFEVQHLTEVEDITSPVDAIAVLLDLGLKKTEGEQTLVALREKLPYVPCLVISKSSSIADRELSRRYECHAYFVKSHDEYESQMEAIVQAIRTAINSAYKKQIQVIDNALNTLTESARAYRENE